MLFHSVDFAVFFPLVYVLYWFVFNRRLLIQNLLLVVASFVFYGWWDWRFLFLIAASIIFDYGVGISLSKTQNAVRRKILLVLSLLFNLGLLGYFKYVNFFIENFNEAFTLLGIGISWARLDIILPVGISFYTFQTLSYTIDVYRNQIKPERNLIVFAGYVSFFPQLVAGPIERSTNLLPQFLKKREFNASKSSDGLKQMLWGFFKKLVIANNLGLIVDQVFANSEQFGGSTLAWVTILFAIQVYADFSGYSDIAIGLSRLFGFNLMQNFKYPFFSRNFQEFWTKWHISLINWLNTYVFNSLGPFTRVKSKIAVRILIVFSLSGLWHGAKWTFVFWGLLNAFLVIYSLYFNKVDKTLVAKGRWFPRLNELFQMISVFAFVSLTGILFRSVNLVQAIEVYGRFFSKSMIDPISVPFKFPLILIVFVIGIEWVGRMNLHALEKLGNQWPLFFRWFFYSLLILAIGLLTPTNLVPFIYFDF